MSRRDREAGSRPNEVRVVTESLPEPSKAPLILEVLFVYPCETNRLVLQCSHMNPEFNPVPKEQEPRRITKREIGAILSPDESDFQNARERLSDKAKIENLLKEQGQFKNIFFTGSSHKERGQEHHRGGSLYFELDDGQLLRIKCRAKNFDVTSSGDERKLQFSKDTSDLDVSIEHFRFSDKVIYISKNDTEQISAEDFGIPYNKKLKLITKPEVGGSIVDFLTEVPEDENVVAIEGAEFVVIKNYATRMHISSRITGVV